MTQTKHIVAARFDPVLYLLLLLTLFTILPLLMQPGLPNGSDVLYHAYRVAEMDRSWANGLLLPRWADGLYYGYGSPLWHFYANLAYMLTSVLLRLGVASALDALRLLLLGSYLGMSLGMYLFVRSHAGRLAGLIAALAYVYAPYILYTEPYARGTYPELLAFAIFPFVMWRFTCLLNSASGRDMLFAALALALLILAHNLMALTLTGLLVAYLIWQAVASFTAQPWGRGREALYPYRLAAASVALGLGLSAYFWLPVLFESASVNLGNLTGVALLDFRNFFVPLAELLSPMPRPDAGAINGLRNVYSLGIAQVLLSLLGLGSVLFGIVRVVQQGRRDDPLLRQGIFFALMGLLMIGLMLPQALGIWETLRPLAYLQFPWRLLGPVAFCMAWLVGMNSLWLSRVALRWPGIAVGAIIVALIASAAPAFYVPEWRHESLDTSITAYHAAEVAGLQRGTTFTDEYRPSTVYSVPGATPRLLDDYANGYPINRANVPAGVVAELLDSGPQHNVWEVRSAREFNMEVLSFYWLGWTAEIDGQRVEIVPSPEHGLITFVVPAGTHQVRVSLGTTGARIAGWTISALALVAALACSAIIRGQSVAAPAVYSRGQALSQSAATTDEQDTEPPIPWAGIVGGGLATVLILFVLMRPGLAWIDSEPGTSPAQTAVHYDLGDSIRLIGYDLNGESFRPGESLQLNLYWYPRQTSEVNFSSFVHVSSGGPPLAQADKLHPGGRAIREWWTPEGYIFDDYRIELPADMPPGEYQIIVGLYTCELMPPGECGNGFRPFVTDEQGIAVGDSIPLAMITVR